MAPSDIARGAQDHYQNLLKTSCASASGACPAKDGDYSFTVNYYYLQATNPHLERIISTTAHYLTIVKTAKAS